MLRWEECSWAREVFVLRAVRAASRVRKCCATRHDGATQAQRMLAVQHVLGGSQASEEAEEGVRDEGERW